METSIAPERASVIKPHVEQTPFREPAMQTLFTNWCEVNDSIMPQYLSREDWEQKRVDGLLQKNRADGKANLLIPEDMKLWEMIDVMEAVDEDTFVNKPDKQRERKEKMDALGKQFINTGIYLAQNLNDVDQGKDIAIATAKDFYQYGNRLQRSDYHEQASFDEIAAGSISDDEIAQIDAWFAVDKSVRYKKSLQNAQQRRGKQITRKEDELGSQRRETLKQFFKAADIAEKGNERYKRAIKNVKGKYLEEPLERPLVEMQKSILARGIEKITTALGKNGWKEEIVKDFKEELGIDLEGQRKTLREILNVPQLKAELDALRHPSNGVSPNITELSKKEREVIDAIQKAVTTLPYETGDEGMGSFPSVIVEQQERNCVGAVLLGSALFEEVGIDYLVGAVPEHVVILTITSDEKVQWREMTGYLSQDLSNNDLEQSLPDSPALTIDDIVAYSKSGSAQGLPLSCPSFVDKHYANQPPEILSNLRRQLIVSHPEKGTYLEVLGNCGAILQRNGEYDSAIVAFEEVLKKEPKDLQTNVNLAEALEAKGDYEKTLEICQFILSIDPTHFTAYDIISHIKFSQGMSQDSYEAAQSSLALNDNNPKAYKILGAIYLNAFEYEDAITSFQRVIDLGTENPDDYYNLGVAHARSKSYEQAAENFQKAVDLGSDDPNLFADLGKTNTLLGNYEQAEKNFRQAIQVGNDQPYIYDELAKVLNQLGKNKEAKVVLKEKRAV